MKVLLISPRDEYIGKNLKYLMGGENTYTRNLLSNPPKGVKYIFYADALEKKYIAYSFLHKPLAILQKFIILPPGPSLMCFVVNKQFDLIHIHGYNALLTGMKAPVVLSDSSSNYLFLKDYLKWTRKRINIQYFFKSIIVKFFSAYDQLLNKQGAQLVVWSEFAKKHHGNYGRKNEEIIVVPPGILRSSIKKTAQASCNILFIGTDFRRKGGELVLAVYKKFKKKYPYISLAIIGEAPKDATFSEDIWHKDYVPHRELIKTIFTKADILVNVPPVAEGFGIVVLEAASFGIPAIVSSVYALPEIVKDGQTGFVIRPGSVEELVVALEKLITNKKLREKMGKAAKKRFMKKFWIEKTNRELLKVYQDVLKKFKS